MGLKNWFHVEPPPLQIVPSDQAENWLAQIPDEVAKELSADLFQFGNLLLTQLSSFTDALESKGVSILGWSIGLLAFLLLTPGWMDAGNWAAVTTTGFTMATTLVALIASFFAITARDWSWPSQADWLRNDLFAQPWRLRQYWLVAMLEAHTAHAQMNRRKASCLVVAQWALVLAGLGVASMVVVRLLLGLAG